MFVQETAYEVPITPQSFSSLSRVHICTQMPNEAGGNERNVDVEVEPRCSEQHSFMWQLFGEQPNAIRLESYSKEKYVRNARLTF